MVWKKVSNSDAGDSTHFGGDDVDKISLTFNAETQTDPINIKDENLLIVDPADTSKKARFDAVGISTSTTRVITLPNSDITIGVASSTSVAGLMSTAQFDKLDAIEASADVTDATNVNAAGALMLTDTTTAGLGIVINEDAMGSNSATKVPTQSSVVAYVASQITAEDLDTAGDSGTGAIDLNSQSLTVSGGSGITTSASSQAITIAGDDATTSAKGVVELATTAELNTGTDTTRAVTVAGIEASARSVKLDAIEASADVTDTANVNSAAATTVGTITSGTWQGTTVAVNQGGTGVTTSTGTGSTVLSASPTFTGTAVFNDLTVNGTTSTINSTTLTVDDKNIELASTASPSDSTANGGGITIKGTSTDKTIAWASATGDFDISENIDIASAKDFKVAGTSVLNATTLGAGVLASSLTSVGTLASPTLTTPDIGTPSAGLLTTCTGLPLTTGVTGVLASANLDADTQHLSVVQTVTGKKTFGGAGAVGKLAVAGTTSGSTIIDATAAAGSGTVILPTTGTLATLAGSEILTGKTLTNPSLGASYLDITRMTAPSDPSANDGRLYVKTIDSNNDGLFMKIKKANGFVEVQIV